MTKEDKLLLAGIEDKIAQCVENYMATYTVFLDMRQRTLAENLCRHQKGLKYIFYGGYEDAERRIGVFLPDYAELEDDNPLALLRITQTGYKELTHRDYLGSLTGLGIKREVVGDILVREKGADIIVTKEMGQFLLLNYEKAGRVSLNAELRPITDLIVPEGRFEERRDTVASLRLDSMIASAFSMSRTRAAEAIREGLVYVNGCQNTKGDAGVKEGDKLVLRGKGKVLLDKIAGVTKKDRIVVKMKRFV